MKTVSAIGADHAVFGGGAGIDGQVFARPPGESIAETVLRSGGTRGVTGEHQVGVDAHVGTYITAQLDAGIGAGDQIETRAVQGADLHVFDRLSLQREDQQPVPRS